MKSTRSFVLSLKLIKSLSLIFETFFISFPNFRLLEILHPTPALSGVPKNISLNWIDILENFSRGNYASPIGWVDYNRNADFRVAIRGARIINKVMELTAGSGIIKGSSSVLEIEEIKLKFETVAKEIFTN